MSKRLEQDRSSCSSAILSPLRYPGGKRRLAGYVAEALQQNGLRPKLYVEPFAGGASVALQLLSTNVVERVALGERDPLVASFWKTVFFDHAWLVREIRKIEPTLEVWKRFRNGRYSSQRTRALACIFLNRTSFSGILSETAGPIGGWQQQSAYTIGCRFSVGTIVERIEQIAALRDRVLFINEGDWRETMAMVRKEGRGMASREIFYYFDPPFYDKADRLYRYYFDEEEHRALRDALFAMKSHYILSYDPAQPIIDLYASGNATLAQVGMLYSAPRSSQLLKMKELIVSNLPELPAERPLWQEKER